MWNEANDYPYYYLIESEDLKKGFRQVAFFSASSQKELTVSVVVSMTCTSNNRSYY